MSVTRRRTRNSPTQSWACTSICRSPPWSTSLCPPSILCTPARCHTHGRPASAETKSRQVRGGGVRGGRRLQSRRKPGRLPLTNLSVFASYSCIPRASSCAIFLARSLAAICRRRKGAGQARSRPANPSRRHVRPEAWTLSAGSWRHPPESSSPGRCRPWTAGTAAGTSCSAWGGTCSSWRRRGSRAPCAPCDVWEKRWPTGDGMACGELDGDRNGDDERGPGTTRTGKGRRAQRVPTRALQIPADPSLRVATLHAEGRCRITRACERNHAVLCDALGGGLAGWRACIRQS